VAVAVALCCAPFTRNGTLTVTVPLEAKPCPETVTVFPGCTGVGLT
jgi:hypothetical protein